jgi:hypothetical protein
MSSLCNDLIKGSMDAAGWIDSLWEMYRKKVVSHSKGSRLDGARWQSQTASVYELILNHMRDDHAGWDILNKK